MKTAISIPDRLFKEIEKIAKDQHSSRSEVFTRAVEEYVEKRRSRQLLDALNEAYATAETPEEYAVREKGRKLYRRTLLKERK